MPLNNLWERFKALFTKKPDTRPDPEDADAYKFVDDVLAEFELEGEHFQVLKGGGKPSDVRKETKIKNKVKAGFDYWIDVYEGPSGKGYVVNFETIRAGKKIRKSVNYGPEDHREADWTEVPTNVL